MRLLYIVPYVPTPVRTRPYHLIKSLAQRGHALTLATLTADAGEEARLQEFRAEGIRVTSAQLTRGASARNVVRGLSGSAPLQAWYCWQPDLMRRLCELVRDEHFDIVHVEHLRGARYGVELRRAYAANPEWRAPPLVWDSVDSIAHLFEQARSASARPGARWMARLELPRTRRHEAWLVEQFSRTLVVSESERAAFINLLGSAPHAAEIEQRVAVVPNGVDLDYFRPPTAPRESATVLFSGKMSYHANVTAAVFLLDEIMPRVWASVPTARVVIAGKDPPAVLVRRAGERVQVTGEVPDLRPYLSRATVACAPIRYGAGVQNKILEAMAMGTAVVTTPLAVQAIAAQPGRDLLTAADAAGMASQILNLFADSALRGHLEQNARAYVETFHPWEASARQLETIYHQAITVF